MRCSLLILAFVGLVVAAVVENGNSSPTSPRGHSSAVNSTPPNKEKSPKKLADQHSHDKKSVDHHTGKNGSPTKRSEDDGKDGSSNIAGSHPVSPTAVTSPPAMPKADISPPSPKVAGSKPVSPTAVTSPLAMPKADISPPSPKVAGSQTDSSYTFDQTINAIKKEIRKKKKRNQYTPAEWRVIDAKIVAIAFENEKQKLDRRFDAIKEIIDQKGANAKFSNEEFENLKEKLVNFKAQNDNLNSGMFKLLKNANDNELGEDESADEDEAVDGSYQEDEKQEILEEYPAIRVRARLTSDSDDNE